VSQPIRTNRTARRSLAVLSLAAALAVIPTVSAQAQDPRKSPERGRADGWTRTMNVDLSPGKLRLPADASRRELARAAIERKAGPLGLRGLLAGLRLADRLPALELDDRAAKLRGFGFQQTAAGKRVIWSGVHVAVTAGRVSSITANVVPARPDRVKGKRQVTRRQALAIAREQVAGPEIARRPRLAAYAGRPTTGETARRTARLAWVVETTPASELGGHLPTGVCVVVDAESGEVIARWHGRAARPRGERSAQRVQVHDHRSIAIVNDGHGGAVGSPGTLYANLRHNGTPFNRFSWIFDEPAVFQPVNPDLDAAMDNLLRLVDHMCFKRDFCGRRGAFGDSQAWFPLLLTGNSAESLNGGLYIPSEERVYGSASFGRAADLIAHEVGHLMDFRYSEPFDRVLDQQTLEVQEGLADMFAYDFDFDDPTLGEDQPYPTPPTSRPRINWANPDSITHLRVNLPYPDRMIEYQCGLGQADRHYNSTILSHGYYLFEQDAKRHVAGAVLQYIPWFLGTRPTFSGVKNGFITRSAELWPFDFDHDGTADVAEKARDAFVNRVGIGVDDPPDC
jgi:hypothetical protein